MPDQAAGGDSHDGVTGKRTDSSVVWDELASTLVAVVASGSSREEIRQAVGPVCARVREERMDVAELVKAVKQVFAGAAGARLDGSERQQLLDRIISVCIDEYYAAS
jgi:hypothetical protein